MNDTIINQNRMDIELSRIVGARFGGMTTVTETDMNKTNGLKGEDKRSNPFYKKVLSVRNISVQFCYDYDAAVDRARVKQGAEAGDWRKGESWHKPIFDDQGRLTAFCEHKTNGSKYIRVRTLHRGKTTYIANERIETEAGVVYNPGDEIPYAELQPFWKATKSYQNQGLNEGKEIAATTLKMTSVRGLRINGHRYLIQQQSQNEPEAVSEVINRFLASMPNVSASDIPLTNASDVSDDD